MFSIRSLIALLLVGNLTIVLCASPAIGVAIAKGSFQIDKSKVYGNSTLFDGTVIQTSEASSDLVLNGGARLRLGSESQARIHRDRLVLERGEGQVTAGAGYPIEVLGLRVAPDSAQSQTSVTYSGPARILVASLGGSARITGPNGVLLAKVTPGSAVDLDMQAAGAAAPTKVTGRLESKKGVFILPDGVSKTTFALDGPTVDQYVGKCVEVSGTLDPSGKSSADSQLLRVLSIKEVAGCAPAAAGFHHGKVLIAGVGVAAAGATAATVAWRGGKGKPPISRKK